MIKPDWAETRSHRAAGFCFGAEERSSADVAGVKEETDWCAPQRFNSNLPRATFRKQAAASLC